MYCELGQRLRIKPEPEDWRAAFRRSVTVLAGSGEIHDVLSRCDRAGLRDELATDRHCERPYLLDRGTGTGPPIEMSVFRGVRQGTKNGWRRQE
jgi:hypothetical protein